MEDFDCQIFPLLPHQLAGFFLHNEARSVVGIDDLVPLLEVADVLNVHLGDLDYRL